MIRIIIASTILVLVTYALAIVMSDWFTAYGAELDKECVIYSDGKTAKLETYTSCLGTYSWFLEKGYHEVDRNKSFWSGYWVIMVR
jgi:hypothetical protein